MEEGKKPYFAGNCILDGNVFIGKNTQTFYSYFEVSHLNNFTVTNNVFLNSGWYSEVTSFYIETFNENCKSQQYITINITNNTFVNTD